MSRRRHTAIPPFLHVRLFQGVASWNPKYVLSGSLRLFSFSLGLKSAGVAPLPPCSRKFLDETVKTFAVFPSWLRLLDGEDNCMSVPISTSDLHCSSWNSGEICQVLSTGAFTLLCHALWFSSKALLSFSCLAHALSARCHLSSRPDTASIRSCLLLPPGFFDTREAGV